MRSDHSFVRNCIPFYLIIAGLISLVVFPMRAKCQGVRMEKGEKAACIIKMNGADAKKASVAKVYNVEPNELGVFKQVSNVKRSEKLSVEILYPSARAGEKIVVNVLDGGMLDNGKGVKVMTLGKERKCVFDFQVADDAGLYRLLVRKGSDTKVVRLWVGSEPAPVKK